MAQYCSKAGERLLVRVLTGLVGIPILLAVIYLGHWPLFALVAGMGLIGFHEYKRLWVAKGVHVPYVLGGLFCFGLYTWAVLTPGNANVLGALFAAAALAVLTWLVFTYPKRTIVDAMVTLGGIVYVGWLLSHLLLLRNLTGGTGWDLGLKWLALALFCTWAADSFAYFVGMSMGRRKLAPQISPGKSVEGVIGGAAAAVVVGWVMSPVVGIVGWQGGLLGLLISPVSVVGDLAESALKRYVGAKDSGSLLPGHGGILDRFDSSLFVFPFVYYVATLLFGR